MWVHERHAAQLSAGPHRVVLHVRLDVPDRVARLVAVHELELRSLWLD